MTWRERLRRPVALMAAMSLVLAQLTFITGPAEAATWVPQYIPLVADANAIDMVDANIGYVAGKGGAMWKTLDGGVSFSHVSTPTSEDLFAVDFVDAGSGYVVGKNGVILKTTNGGATWTLQNHPAGTVSLTGVSFPVDAMSGTAVGDGPTILITVNGGATWELRSGVTNQLEAVDFPVDNITGFAVGLGGRVVKTTNSGVSWGALSSPTTDDLFGVDFLSDGVTGYAVGKAGIIFKTTDGAASWASQVSGTTEDLFSVYFADASSGYVVGKNGVILKTTDGGATWTPQAHPGGTAMLTGVDFPVDAMSGTTVGDGPTILITVNGGATWELRSGVTNQLEAVDFPVDNITGFAVGLGGRVVKTTNSGVSWGALSSPTTEDLFGVDFLSDGVTGYAVGKAGIIFKTTDGAASWASQVSGTTEDLFSVYFADATTGYATGRNGTILKTIDSGTTWVAQTSGVTKHLYQSYFPIDATTGFVVGESGTILKTTDSGSTWAPQVSGVTKHLEGLHFPTGATIGYAIGEGGTILKTIDGGTTWGPQTSGVTKNLLDVSFADDSVGYTAGQDGTILKTIDGGTTWTPQTSATTEDLFGVMFPVDGSTGFAVGKNALTPHTTDGGATWVVSTVATTENLAAVDYSSATTGYATGINGAIIKTTDGGATWAAQASGVTKGLFGVSFADDSVGYTVGQTGTILSTTDGGATWAPQTSATTEDLFGVVFPVDGSTGFAVGKNAVTPHTTDGGATWLVPTAATTENLLAVDYPSALIGYATGANGDIIKTTDGGITWVAQGSGTTDDLAGVSFVDDSVGYTAGQNGTILKTTNGGVTWVPQVSATTEDLLDINFADALNGVAGGTAKAAVVTTDGGATWLPLSNSIPGDIPGVATPVAGTILMVGPGPSIVRTTDGGATWTSPIPSTLKLFALDFATAAIGYAVGEKGTALKTTDGGANWNPLGTPDITNFEGVDFVTATTGYVVGKGGTILKTTDGGSTFLSLPSGTTQDLFAVSFPVDATTGFAVGKNGTIVKTTDSGASWVIQASGTLEDLFGVDFADNAIGVAVGKNGIIVRTTNGGSGWSTRTSGVLSDLFAAEFTSNPSIVYVVGKSGVVLKSTNGGSGWSSLASGTTQDLEDVSFPVDAVTGFVAGSKGVVMMTTDGSSWTPSDNPVSARLHSIAFTSNSVGAAVGDGPTIITTADPTDEWIDQTPSAGHVFAIDFPTGTATGFAVGQKGTVLKTTNGVNWQALTRPTTEDLVGLDFADDSIGFTVAKAGLILKTTNGGSSWSTLTSGTIKDLKGVAFPVDAVTGFVVGKDGTILKTTDGGSGWSALTSGTTKDLFAVTFPTDATTGFTVGQDGTILKTTDGGGSWATQTTPTTEDLLAVSFPFDTMIGYAAGKKGVVLKTTDGGGSWASQTTPTTEDLFGIDFVTGDLGHAVGKNGTILHTADGGAGWTSDTSGTTKTLRAVQFPVNAADGWVGGEGPNILHGADALPPNNPPTDIGLSPSTVAENVPIGTVVGTLSTSDPDPGDTHTYALVAGVGDGDNGLFVMVGDEIRTSAALDFETLGSPLAIRVETTDSGAGNLTFQKALSVTLTDVNDAPVLDAVGAQAGDEQTVIGFTATGSDPDSDGLTFTVEDGAGTVPPGAVITAGGVFSWTPSEAQGAGVYSFDVVVTDDGSPNLVDRETITVTVGEVNVAPVADVIVDQFPNEGSLVSLTATASDADLPANGLTWTKDSGPGSVDGSGNYLWATTEADGPGTYTVVLRVTDDGTPNLDDTVIFDITVGEINQVPVLDAVGAQSGDEGTLIGFTATATDADVPANGLTFTLEDGAGSVPPGAVITGGGVFSWTPSEAQGAGVYSFDVVVTDDGSPNLEDRETITVTVNEVNLAPVAVAILDQFPTEGDSVNLVATASDADLPANGLTWTKDSGPGSVDGSGNYSWATTEADGPGTYTVVLRVTDDGTPNLDDTVSFDVTVAEINQAPVLDLVGAQLGDEGTLIGFTATATDADVPANGLTFTLEDGAGSVPPGAVITGGGVFSWTPSEAQGAGVYSFDVVVTDDGTPNLEDRETITVTVDEVNVAPVTINPGDQFNAESDVVSLFVGATDADVPANTLTWSDAGLPPGLSINPVTGEITGVVDPLAAAGSPYAVTITVTDDGSPNLQDVVGFSWTVTDVNRSPVLDAVGAQAGDEQTVIGFIATGSDPDGDGLTFTLEDGAGSVPVGAVITTGGVFSWTPTEAQGAGMYSFDVVVTDDGTPNMEDRETITVTVNEVNVAPTLEPIADMTQDENTFVTFTAAGADADLPANGLAYSLSGAPAGASMNPTSGVFAWIPSEPQGPNVYTFDVVLTDDGSPNLSVTQSVTITVLESNRDPILDPIGPQTGDEETLISFAAAAVDLDQPANGLLFSLAGAPAGASIDPVTGVFSWSPTEAQGPGVFTFDVVVTDDGSPVASDFETITMTVNEVNQAPTLDPIGAQTVDELTAVSLTATASDLDLPAESLTFSLDGAPTGASITAAGVFTFVPTEGQGPGSYAFDVVVTDNGSPNLEDRETITVTVTEVNTAPTLNPIGNRSVDEGSTLVFAATSTDPDIPSTRTYSLQDGTGLVPSGAAIDPLLGLFGWAPTEADGPGVYTFDVVVTDNTGLEGLETISVTVNEMNDAPVLDPIGDLSVDEMVPLSFLATASDGDLPANALSFSLSGEPAGATISSGGWFTWTPTEAQGPGVYTFSVVVTDDGAPPLSDSDTITVTVGEIGEAPILDPINDQVVDEGVALEFTAFATDPDLPPATITYSLVGSPAEASIDPASGEFAWTPTEAQGPGVFVFDVVASDDSGESSNVSVSVAVNEVNVAPTILDSGEQSSSVGELVSLPLVGSDTDLPTNALTWSANGLPDGLSIDPLTGLISGIVETDAGAGSPFAVTVGLSDAGAPSLSATLTFSWVVAENTSPSTSPDFYQMAPGATLVVDAPGILGNDDDLNGDILKAVLVTPPTNGTLTLNDDGSFIYTHDGPEGDGLLEDQFVYQAEDGRGGATPDTVTISFVEASLPPSNLPPVLVDDTLTILEDGSGTLAPLANDSDPNGDILTLVDFTQPEFGFIVANPRGELTYSPPVNFFGEVSATYSATDGNGVVGTAIITIIVESVNDVPIGTQDSVTFDSYLPMVIDLLANDRDVEGDALRISDIAGDFSGQAVINQNGTITYQPGPGFVGVEVLQYFLDDGQGGISSVLVTITVPERALQDALELGEQIGSPLLGFEAPRSDANAQTLAIGFSQGVSLVAQSFFQSLDALRLPILFLGLALGTFVVLGSFTELPILLASRRRRYYSVVFLGRESRLSVSEEPSPSAPGVYHYEATAAGVRSLDKPKVVDGTSWIPVESPNGAGWVNGSYLTESVDLQFFLDDDRPAEMLQRLGEGLSNGKNISKLFGTRGFAVALNNQPELISSEDLDQALADPNATPLSASLWEKVFVPLSLALEGVQDHDPNMKHSTASLIPVELWNLQYLTVSAPDQPAWLVYFAYEKGKPKITAIGLDV